MNSRRTWSRGARAAALAGLVLASIGGVARSARSQGSAPAQIAAPNPHGAPAAGTPRPQGAPMPIAAPRPQGAPMPIAAPRPQGAPMPIAAPRPPSPFGGPARPGAFVPTAHQGAPAAAGQAAGHGRAEHESAEEDESAPPGPINWWHGMLGTKPGVEPNLLWRAPGEPAPFLASFLNFAVLVFVFVRFGRKPLAEALARRKSNIMHEIEHAQKLKEEAEARLRSYQSKIDRIEEEIERIRVELRDQGERERERIVREAGERRERMRKDAELLLTQELKQLQVDLQREIIDAALSSAAELVAARVTQADHERLVESFLAQLPGAREGGQPAAYPAVAAGRERLS